MKKLWITVASMTFCGLAVAQGYAGAVVALTKLGADCAGMMSCDTKGHGVKIYFGSKLIKSDQFDFGVGVVDAVEFGVMSFGKGAVNYSKEYVDAVNGGPNIVAAATTVNTANALIASVVARVPLFEGANFLVRPGVAYVSSTQRYYVSGIQNGSETATKFKPYLGLGFDFSPMDGVKFVGSFDWTKFDVASQKSNLTSLGLGAEIGF